mgnify:CR=1 FL=1
MDNWTDVDKGEDKAQTAASFVANLTKSCGFGKSANKDPTYFREVLKAQIASQLGRGNSCTLKYRRGLGRIWA